MAEALAALLDHARRWLEGARDAGWLDDALLARLDAIERASPADLFREPTARPLVVSLFGGTGVGKSSLLNRLSGQALARTGVERPTSHEVTLFLHESVGLADLPKELPLDAVRVVRHSSDAFRDVAWLDMPDIDSVAELNRTTALAWLPFVDLVCYVVSPERYRDDRGWRVLLDRRQRHGWLFVMNRWDEGHSDQAADFVRLLQGTGFERPTLVRTCCRLSDRGAATQLPSPDEFDQIPATVRTLVAANIASQLSLAAELARVRDVRCVLSEALARFGDDALWDRAIAGIQRRWDETGRTIATGLEYSIRAAAVQFGEHDALAWRNAVAELLRKREDPAAPRASDATAPQSAGGRLTPALWDAWSETKLAACFDAVEVDAAKLGVPPHPLRAALEATASKVAGVVQGHVNDALRAALAQPGTALTRALRRLTGFLMTFLPFLTLLWIAFGVVRGFYAGVHQGQPFQGTAFAINSLLMLGVAWAVPFAIDWRLRPSLCAVAERGLRDGLARGLAAAGGVLDGVAEAIARDAAVVRERGAELVQSCDRRLATPLAPDAAAIVARVA